MKAGDRIDRRGGARPGAGRKKRDRRLVVLTIDPALVGRLDAVTNNRSRYIAELLDRVLPRDEGARAEELQ